MKKAILNLGKTLNANEQKSITGGIFPIDPTPLPCKETNCTGNIGVCRAGICYYYL